MHSSVTKNRRTLAAEADTDTDADADAGAQVDGAAAMTQQQQQQQRSNRPREALQVGVSNEDGGNQDANRSNDDTGCVEPPVNAGSVLVEYEYNLNVMPGADRAKAVAQVDAGMPERIAMELGIWCEKDEDDALDADVDPLDRRRNLATKEGGQPRQQPRSLSYSADGIYELTEGEPDVVRTDVQCESTVYGYECVPVKASIGVNFDADATNAEDASKHLKAYISGLMEHELIRRPTYQASYVGLRPFDSRPTFGGAGGSGGIVSSTAGETGTYISSKSSDANGNDGLTTMGKAFLAAFSVLGAMIAFAVYRKNRRGSTNASRSEVDEQDGSRAGAGILSAAPEKPSSGGEDDDDATLDLDLEISQSREVESFDQAEEAEAEAEAAEILEDIKRTVSLPSNQPPGLAVVHENFDPNEESEV